MTILQDIGLFCIDSNRTRAYLAEMAMRGLQPSIVLWLHEDGQRSPEQAAADRSQPEVPDEVESIYRDYLARPFSDLIEDLNVECRKINSLDVNSQDVLDAVEEIDQSVLIYSGPGGGILRKPLLSKGKRFLHVHPGRLPAYRGSTTIYYSLLREGKCGATALFLNEAIDAGDVVKGKDFAPPEDREKIDLHYDPIIRAKVLGEVLADYAETGDFVAERQEADGGETYFIIHPFLKHMAIYSSQSKQLGK